MIADQLEMTGTPGEGRGEGGEGRGGEGRGGEGRGGEGRGGEGRGEGREERGGEGRRGGHITYIHSDTYIHAKMMHNIILTVCMCATTHIHLLLNAYRF